MTAVSQALFIAKKGDKELLIPITDQIITKVDRENKTIEVSTPEGLVALYLGEPINAVGLKSLKAHLKLLCSFK